MVVLAVCAWLLPPSALGITIWSVARSRAISSAMKNAVATGVAAASMVFVFFAITGISLHGPWAETPKLGWLWRVPMFATFAAAFAWCSGWACATLYLALRQAIRGHWRQPGCPTPMQTALAFITLLGLAVFYIELAADAAAALTDRRLAG